MTPVYKLSDARSLTGTATYYSSMLAGNAAYSPVPPSAYDLLETTILTASQASVTFSSLNNYAADYQHLQLRIVSRDSGGNLNGTALRMQLNSDTGSNYAFHRLTGNGSSVSSIANASIGYIFLSAHPAANDGANSFGATVVDILDPFETKYTTTRSLTGWTGTSYNNIWLNSGLWQNTSAVDSIYLYTASTAFLTGSRISLYGLRSV